MPNYPSSIVTTIGTTVKCAMLPLGTRVPLTYTITAATPAAVTITVGTGGIASGGTSLPVEPLVGALRAGTVLNFTSPTTTVTVAANARKGDTKIKVNPVSTAIAAAATGSYTPVANALGNNLLYTAATPVLLDAGEVLTFGSTKATISEVAPQGSNVLILDAPLEAAITAGTTATTKALVNIVGCTNATPASSPKTVDTTNYLSGAGVEMGVIGTNRTLKVEFNRISGDLGGNIIMEMLYNDAYFNREIYAVVQRPNGEIFEGAAIITQGDANAPVQEKVSQTADMQFQGASFKRTAATEDDVITLLSLAAV